MYNFDWLFWYSIWILGFMVALLVGYIALKLWFKRDRHERKYWDIKRLKVAKR